MLSRDKGAERAGDAAVCRARCATPALEFRFIQPLLVFYTMAGELHWHLYGLIRTFAGKMPMLLIDIEGGLGALGRIWLRGSSSAFHNQIFCFLVQILRLIQLGTLRA